MFFGRIFLKRVLNVMKKKDNYKKVDLHLSKKIEYDIQGANKYKKDLNRH